MVEKTTRWELPTTEKQEEEELQEKDPVLKEIPASSTYRKCTGTGKISRPKDNSQYYTDPSQSQKIKAPEFLIQTNT